MLDSDAIGEQEAWPKRISRKAVLSLDTNYLSNLARARLREGLPSHVLDSWVKLLSALTEAVWDDRLVCPGFNVQVEELEMDDRIVGPACVILRSLSLGLVFHSLDGIVARQVEDVALRYLQRAPVAGPAWSRVLQDDPDLPAVELSRRARSSLPFTMCDPQAIEKHRQGRECLGVREGVTGPVLDVVLHGAAVESRLAFARLIIGRRIRDAFAGLDAAVTPWPLDSRAAEWSGLASRVRSAGMGLRDFIGFLESPWLAHVPFVDLYCSLVRAAAQESATGRPDQASDEADRCIVAALLPYCGLVTTDRFVKHLVTAGLHLDARYGCRVFSGRLDDVHLLTEVVKALPAVSV